MLRKISLHSGMFNNVYNNIYKGKKNSYFKTDIYN